jgi:hypothetical protein
VPNDQFQKRTLIARIIKQLPLNSIRNPEAVLMNMTVSGLNNLDVALTLLGRSEEIAAADGLLAARLLPGKSLTARGITSI